MKTIFSIFFFFLSAILWANDSEFTYPQLTDKAEVSVLTVGTGSELYTLFGHTALRIYDPLMRIDRIYNYGLFDFRTPNFYSKFIKGDLMYFAGYEDYRDFVMGYAYEDRPVYEQHLVLSQEQKQQIWELANRSLEEDRKFYNYKFSRQNCTTKIVDLLNEVLKEPVKVDAFQEEVTYRSILNKSLDGHFFEKLGINLLFSSKLDQKPTLLFLPDTFMRGLAVSSNDGSALVDKTSVLYEKQQIAKGDWWNTFAFFAVIMAGLALLIRNTTARYGYFVVVGLFGCLLVFISIYSSHIELSGNDTALLCSPLMLLLPWIGKRLKYKRTAVVLCLLMGLSIMVFAVLNLTSQKLFLTLPILLVNLWALFLEGKIQKTVLNPSMD